ncbi:MAG: hypothetical protein K0R65_1836 [Crocinitomicaceae bacterium]|jgi:hypothetical protein|nr:hypothetical protein [Crocinitomicaceae bacterium]
MNKIILFFLFSFFYFYSQADWVNLNTGIQDDLTGIVFKGDKAMVSGKKGLYYTFDGGINGASSWNRFNITTNAADSLIYNNSTFTSCFSKPDNYLSDVSYYACGQDTVNHKAVLFKINCNDLSYTILYYGETGSKLNDIDLGSYATKYVAVGDNGLIVSFSASASTASVVNLSLTANLEAIDFHEGYFCILGENFYYRGTITSDILALTHSVAITPDLKDLIIYNSSNASLVGEKLYSSNFITLNDESSRYDFGNLNGQAITFLSSRFFIGTDHGIFKSTTAQAYELQPSSAGYSIRKFWFTIYNTTNFYACGDNGTILTTTDLGGATKPFANILFNGGCYINGSYALTCTQGSSTYCSWYKNGSYIGSGCTGYYHNFGPAGSYELKLICSNGIYMDTAVKIVHIVTPPEKNLPVTLTDSILCKSEQLFMQIDSSQVNVYYTLKKFGSPVSYGVSQIGNNGVLNFTSQLLNTSGNYFLTAVHTQANCTSAFTDTIKITVEHPKAALHCNKINAYPGEEVRFYEHCREAANFKWVFTNQAQDSISNLPDPVNHFAAYGNVDVKLVSWTDNFCYDSVEQSTVRIYPDDNNNDSIWTSINQGLDPDWPGFYTPDISELSQARDGYLATGFFQNCTFKSRAGDSLYLDGRGGYLIKYNDKGVIKWLVKTIQSTDYTTYQNLISNVVEDHDGNIYISGHTLKEVVVNTGDSLDMEYYFLLKLDSLGNLIWHRSSRYLVFHELKIDPSNNLVAVAGYLNEQTYVPFYFNGVPVDTIRSQASLYEWDGNQIFFKIAPGGNLISRFEIERHTINTSGTFEVGFDNLNNIYVSGTYQDYARFYSAGQTSYEEVEGQVDSYGGNIFVVKFNSAGILQWKLRSYTLINGSISGDTEARCMVTDSAGNCYISGRNDAGRYYSSPVHKIENTDGTVTNCYEGRFFIMKINPEGVCQWIHGTHKVFYGSGYKIIKTADEIAVVGKMQNNGVSIPCNSLFSGSDSLSIYLSIEYDDYFIAYYDFDGNLKRIQMNDSTRNFVRTENFNGFFEDESGNFILGQNIHFYDPTMPYPNFGDTIYGGLTDDENNTGYEGLVTRFTKTSGIVKYPVQPVYADLVICGGDSYTFPDGYEEVNIVSPREYACLLSSVNNTDSVVIYRILPVYFPDTHEYVTICAGEDYTFPDGTTATNITAALNHNNEFQSQNGCDSTFITHLSVSPEYNYTQNVTVCMGASYVFPDGTEVQNVSATISNTSSLQNIHGCDSTIVTTLHAQAALSINVTDSVCRGSDYTFPDGTLAEDIQGPLTHDNLLETIYGCDSVVHMNLTLKTINDLLTVNTNSIFSHENNAVYQWLDCDNSLAPIPGASAISYVPSLDGSYAVAITKNSCTDTSQCVDFTLSGLEEDILTYISIYPNPTEGTLYITPVYGDEKYSFRILNVIGQEIVFRELHTSSNIEISFDAAPGCYYLEIILPDGRKSVYDIIRN